MLGAASQLVNPPERTSATMRRAARALVAVVVLVSALGVVLMHSRDDIRVAWARAPAFGPLSKGSIDDPGTKSAAFLIRSAALRMRTGAQPASVSWNVLALDRAIEPPIATYYFARDANVNVLAFYDAPDDAAPALLAQHAHAADIVICDPAQASLLDSQPQFRRAATVRELGKARLLIYARAALDLALEDVDVAVGNARFDATFPLRLDEHRSGP